MSLSDDISYKQRGCQGKRHGLNKILSEFSENVCNVKALLLSLSKQTFGLNDRRAAFV